jgi:hypothetical protein
VVFTCGDLEDGEGAVHMLEGSREVAAGVVVKGEVGIAIGCLRVVTA